MNTRTIRMMVLTAWLPLSCSLGTEHLAGAAGGPATTGTEQVGQEAGEHQVFARKMFEELNKLRKEPRSFMPDLEARLTRFEGSRLRLDEQTVLVTREGPAAVKEAMGFLAKTAGMKPFVSSEALDRAAQAHVDDLGPKGRVGHGGTDGSSPGDRMGRFAELEVASAENLAFGENGPRGVVLQLLIDDGVPNRGHRRNIFSEKFKVVGVACGPHKVYGRMCVMDFAGGVKPKVNKGDGVSSND